MTATLPPLPIETLHDGQHIYFTAAQMRAYGAACAAAELRRLSVENDRLTAERDAFKAQCYADANLELRQIGGAKNDEDMNVFSLRMINERNDNARDARMYFAERNSARDAWRRAANARDALQAGLDAALDFAGTVGGGASWWDDVWRAHEAAIDAAREARGETVGGPAMSKSAHLLSRMASRSAERVPLTDEQMLEALDGVPMAARAACGFGSNS